MKYIFFLAALIISNCNLTAVSRTKSNLFEQTAQKQLNASPQIKLLLESFNDPAVLIEIIPLLVKAHVIEMMRSEFCRVYSSNLVADKNAMEPFTGFFSHYTLMFLGLDLISRALILYAKNPDFIKAVSRASCQTTQMQLTQVIKKNTPQKMWGYTFGVDTAKGYAIESGFDYAKKNVIPFCINSIKADLKRQMYESPLYQMALRCRKARLNVVALNSEQSPIPVNSRSLRKSTR
ncbi:hypothetical protein BH09DEP1_BH09DEP1_7450 [soil metagenome]